MSSYPFEVRLADGPADVAAAQALRYRVFVEEGGASGEMVDHVRLREGDHYDDIADHLLLCDLTLPTDQQVVGTYRLMTGDQAKKAGGFYSAGEFDLSALLSSQRSVLELGRSCLLKRYRGGAALLHMWRGLGRYVDQHNIDVLFGVASFPGTDPKIHGQALTLLHREYAIADNVSPRAYGAAAFDTNLLGVADLNRRAALTSMPTLIKSYLRLGGRVGQGAYIDHDFNTIDVCMVLHASNVSARQRAVLEEAV